MPAVLSEIARVEREIDKMTNKPDRSLLARESLTRDFDCRGPMSTLRCHEIEKGAHVPLSQWCNYCLMIALAEKASLLHAAETPSPAPETEADECPTCDRGLRGSFPTCIDCQLVEALKGGPGPETEAESLIAEWRNSSPNRTGLYARELCADALTPIVARWREEREELIAERDDYKQQVEVLKPGGRYAWKTKFEQAEATCARLEAELTNERRERERAQLGVVDFGRSLQESAKDVAGLTEQLKHWQHCHGVTADRLVTVEAERTALREALHALYTLMPDCDGDYLLDGTKGEFVLKAIRVTGIGEACQKARAVLAAAPSASQVATPEPQEKQP